MNKKIILSILFGLTLTFFSCTKAPADPTDTITLKQLNEPFVPQTTFASTTFWTRSTVYNYTGPIDIYIDGAYSGTITNYSSTNAGCGLSYNVTTSLTTGSHTWYGISSSGAYQFASSSSPRSFTVTNIACNKVEIVF